MSAARVLRSGEHREMPWRNGQGLTWEVAVEPDSAAPGDGFDWRVSFARVEGETTFSTFDGVDRVLVLADGDGLALTVDGQLHELDRFDGLAFAGEAVVTGRASGRTVDFNVMSRRDTYTAAVACPRLQPGDPYLPAPAGPNETRLVAVLAGSAAVALADGSTTLLGARDVLRGDALLIDGQGCVAVVTLSRR